MFTTRKRVKLSFGVHNSTPVFYILIVIVENVSIILYTSRVTQLYLTIIYSKVTTFLSFTKFIPESFGNDVPFATNFVIGFVNTIRVANCTLELFKSFLVVYLIF